jgi:hypothetical protein
MCWLEVGSLSVMNKRYQVFVSSTFRDLVEERREVMQALLEMDCIPAGMELFPAANEQAWKLIKRVIEESDYYCLIVGGRYGSTDEHGLSFTEREYDYALKVDLPIMAFLHAKPDDIPSGKVDRDENAARRLREFRVKVEKRHHCKFWAGAEDLGGKVSRAMVQIFKSNPRVGWVRADQVASVRALNDLEKLRRQAEQLQSELERVKKEPAPKIDGLACGGELVPFKFSYEVYTAPPAGHSRGNPRPSRKIIEQVPLTWDEAFAVMGAKMLGGESEWSIRNALEEKLRTIKEADPKFLEEEGHSLNVSNTDEFACLTQFVALGLAQVQEKNERGRSETTWRLTQYGRDHLLRVGTIQRTRDANRGDSRVESKTPHNEPKRRSRRVNSNSGATASAAPKTGHVPTGGQS